ncbi:MAG: hypothetical protein L7S65_01050 [Schleiferiaceae bacterium]|nr:hypothetical protein [Schleiferiaceae bacterium]
MKVLFVFASLWFSSFSPETASPTNVRHDFYVSVTDLNVDVNKGVVTGVVKTFPDDWERAMNALLQEKVQRYIALDSAAQHVLHAAYIQSHLQITLNGEILPITFHATVNGPDELYLLFVADYGEKEVEDLSGKWSVQNEFLADIYPTQENIVLFHYEGDQQTNSCREGNNYRLQFGF